MSFILEPRANEERESKRTAQELLDKEGLGGTRPLEVVETKEDVRRGYGPGCRLPGWHIPVSGDGRRVGGSSISGWTYKTIFRRLVH